jgi:hypothetical protein
MTRRTAILVGLLCLLGASAFGARAVFSGGSPSPTTVRQGAFVRVAGGQAGEDRWTLRLYTRDGQLCRALVVLDQAESSRCAPVPGANTLGVTSLTSARRRYVFGVVGGRIAAVRVRAGAAALTVPTHALGDPGFGPTRPPGLAPATRYFIAILPRASGRHESPALATGLDGANGQVGRSRILCAEEPGEEPCP